MNLLERALQRPLNHSELSASQQWAVDKELGILDWDPTLAEGEQYIQRRIQMGDPFWIELRKDRDVPHE